MTKYPVFLEISGRRTVIIGAGSVALRKTESLLSAGTDLLIVAENITDDFQRLCQNSDAKIVQGQYDKKYLKGAFLVIAATDNFQLNRQIYYDCSSLEILCNVVDDPDRCDFIVPSVIKRGFLQIAVSTTGLCPAYARKLREEISRVITETHGDFLIELKTIRKQIISDIADIKKRKQLLADLVDDDSFEVFVQKGAGVWRKYALDKIMKCN